MHNNQTILVEPGSMCVLPYAESTNVPPALFSRLIVPTPWKRFSQGTMVYCPNDANVHDAAGWQKSCR